MSYRRQQLFEIIRKCKLAQKHKSFVHTLKQNDGVIFQNSRFLKSLLIILSCCVAIGSFRVILINVRGIQITIAQANKY